MIRTNIQLAIASLKSSKIRSLLTMVAVIFGVASFVIVTSIVDGLRNSTVQEINDLGGNLLSIVSGDVIVEDESGNESFNFLAAQGDSTLTEEDLATVKKTEGVRSVAPLSLLTGSVYRGDNQLKNALIITTTEDYPETFSHQLEEGAFLKDDSQQGKFAVIGSTVENDLYGGDAALGSKITIKGEDFTIIGKMEEQKSTVGELFGINQNNAVYISIENGKKLSNGAPALFEEIDIKLEESADPNVVIADLEAKILENHNGEVDFSILKQDQLVGLVDTLLGTIKLAGQFLSFIMLTVASVVILLIMLITVRERTREIGIRKSIGATNSNILVQFLTEAVILSWIGSLLGLIAGYAIGILAERFTGIAPQYSVNTLLLLFFISTMVGIIAGIIPAWMAARRNPVESLRSAE